MLKRLFSLILLSLLAIISTSFLSACNSKESSSSGHKFTMASMEDMPVEVKEAPKAVQESYQFAVANPDALTDIPCYCGCGSMGHTSNYACYVESVDSDGTINYESHSLGCSICVDITQDVMRLMDEGKDHAAIRAYIDTTYSQYGPSNIP